MSRRRAKTKSTTTFLIVLFFMFNVVASEIQPMGSILFEDHGFPKKCFVQDDIALLSTRLKFQDLLPNEGERSLMNDEGATAIVRYFYGINEIIEKMSEDETRHLMQKSFYDLVGSFLKQQILPIAKFSFYSGNVTFAVIQNLFSLYERSKELLDTNGNGWNNPITDFSQFSFNIDPLKIPKTSDDESMKACGNLLMKQNDDDYDEDMLVPLPKMETEESEELSTIWLPLKRKHIFNINSRTSAFILFRYFVIVTQCYNYQGINQEMFNRKLKLWIDENVLPYLHDEKLYPAFGAVLRILETIKDPNEGGYTGMRKRHRTKHRRLREEVKDFEKCEKVFRIEADTEIELWYRTAMVGCAIIVITFLVIFLIVRICKNQKTVAKESFDEKRRKRRSLLQKLLNCCKRNSHRNDPEEFYQYKKATSGTRIVAFENEKKMRKQKGKKNSKEKFNLPLLGGASDSETEVFAKTSSSSFSKGTFKISESSDDGSNCKNSSNILSKSSLKATDSKSSNKLPEKTPQRYEKSQQRQAKSSDTR